MSYVIGHHMKRKRKAEEKASLNPDIKTKKRSRSEIFNDVVLFETEEKKLTNATTDETLQLVKEEKEEPPVPIKRTKKRKTTPEPDIVDVDEISTEPAVSESAPVKKTRAKRKSKTTESNEISVS